MNYNEYEDIIKPEFAKSIYISDLKNKKSRTLLYGYTDDRYSWHLYLNKDKNFKFIMYSSDYSWNNDTSAIVSILNFEHIITNVQNLTARVKRLYPESCDYEFCVLAKQNGMPLNFVHFDVKRQDQVNRLQYHGKLIPEDY